MLNIQDMTTKELYEHEDVIEVFKYRELIIFKELRNDIHVNFTWMSLDGTSIEDQICLKWMCHQYMELDWKIKNNNNSTPFEKKLDELKSDIKYIINSIDSIVELIGE